MIVQLKVLMNADEINEAKKKNEFYANKRKQNETLAKNKRVEVPEDVEVPEKEIEVKDWLIDVDDVKDARIDEMGMISIFHLYRGERQVVYSDEVWEQLKQRFS